jgi:hypothetical protein
MTPTNRANETLHPAIQTPSLLSGHFRSQSLEALIGFAERFACRLQSSLQPLLNLLTHSVSLIGHPLGF